MKFNTNNIISIYESNDILGSNLDNTLSNTTLLDIFDNICPISGDVYATMKGTAADPKNLKITVSNKNDGEHSLFIEASEFINFCEAGEFTTIKEAADSIINEYEYEIPGIGVKDINIVFPSDALNKNELGINKDGIDTNNSWATQLLSGCRRYGLIPRVSKE